MLISFPLDGLMFWSDWGEEAMIERANMDGTSRVIIASKKLIWPNGLAIDYDQQKLYFVDGGTKTLENMNFDGSSRKVIISKYPNPRLTNQSFDDLVSLFRWSWSSLWAGCERWACLLDRLGHQIGHER